MPTDKHHCGLDRPGTTSQRSITTTFSLPDRGLPIENLGTIWPLAAQFMERTTGFEPATLTLAR